MKMTSELFLKSYFKALIDNEQKLRDVALEGGRHTSIECLGVNVDIDLNCGWCFNLRPLRIALDLNYPDSMRYFNFTHALVLQERLIAKRGLDKMYPVSTSSRCSCAQYAVGPHKKWGEGPYAERRWELIKDLYTELEAGDVTL